MFNARLLRDRFDDSRGQPVAPLPAQSSTPTGSAPACVAPAPVATPPDPSLWMAIFKRLFDVAFALVFLGVAAPFLVLLALALRLDSPGPLFYVQQRVGGGGKPFGCLKLRTMRVDADAVLAALLASSAEARREWAADHKLRNDPRITRLGRIVRKLSLDELPQLFNILRGEMSVVGPRPIVRAEIPRYGASFAWYCAVRPGLTGLWQVSGRNDTSYARRVELDTLYGSSASFLLDIGIILRTVPAVLRARGSY